MLVDKPSKIYNYNLKFGFNCLVKLSCLLITNIVRFIHFSIVLLRSTNTICFQTVDLCSSSDDENDVGASEESGHAVRVSCVIHYYLHFQFTAS